jgi:peptide/nickel transport system substrate-binding protein
MLPNLVTEFRLLAILLLAALGGCGENELPTGSSTDSPSSFEPDKTLRIGISQYPSTLHPTIENMVAKFYALGMLTRSVTTFDPDWNLVCNLCITLPTIENGLAVLEKTPDGKEGMAVTYEIPETSSWGDGTPLTTADIHFAWRVGRNTQVGANNIEMYRRIYAFDVHDETTFTIHIDKVVYNYNGLLQLFPLPRHLEEEIFNEDAYEYRHRTNYNANASNPGLWSGPYIVKELAQGSFLRMTRNPYWRGKTPYFDMIEIRAIQNTAAMEANLLSGTIDMVAGELGLTLDQGLSFEKRHGDKYNVIYKPGLLYEHADLNLENPILVDKRVRKALMYGIDRQQISERLFGGKQPVAHSSVSPLGKNASEDIETYNHDPALAGKLLDEAGWSTIVDGVRTNAAGESLRIEIMTTAGDKTRELVEQVLQGQLREIGVDLRIKNESARVFFGQTTRERKFTGIAMYAWSSAPGAVPRATLHSSEIPSSENNYAGQNYSSIRMPELDRLIEDLERELNADGRIAIWDGIQKIYADELFIFPLYWRSNVHILPHWLKDLQPTGHIVSSTVQIENWKREG